MQVRKWFHRAPRMAQRRNKVRPRAVGCAARLYPLYAAMASSPGTIPTARKDDALCARWAMLQRWTFNRFGREPDLEGILFLIGIQELGHGYLSDLDKARKEQLVLEGTYSALETLGYYERVGMENNGHWIWELRSPLPADLSPEAEERMLQRAVLRYFDNNLKQWTDES